MFQEIPELMVK